MNLDHQAHGFMKNILMEPKNGKSHPNLGRVFPAAIALWHSPIFVLDPYIDLSTFDFRTRDFTLQKLVNVSSIQLLAWLLFNLLTELASLLFLMLLVLASGPLRRNSVYGVLSVKSWEVPNMPNKSSRWKSLAISIRNYRRK